MLMLQQAELYTPLLLDMLEEKFDPAAFRRTWRSARRRSAAYWLGLAQALLRRRNPQAALRAIAAARALPHPEPAWIDLTEAEARAALGDPASARMLAEKWAEDAAFGPVARGALAQWPAPPTPRPLWRRLGGKAKRALRRVLP
jgi:hypothetical protein